MVKRTNGTRLVTIDEARKHKLLTRLRKAEGQVKGIQRMVEEGRYCVEILQQLAAADEALKATARDVLRNYLENCATTAIRSGSASEAQRVYDEITENFFRFAR